MSEPDTHNIDSLVGATYFVVGRGTEGGQAAYHLTIAGTTVGKSDPGWGSVEKVAANSGYSPGTIQVDLGQRGTWTLGATSDAPLKTGESTYVDAIIGQASKYASGHDLTSKPGTASPHLSIAASITQFTSRAIHLPRSPSPLTFPVTGR